MLRVPELLVIVSAPHKTSKFYSCERCRRCCRVSPKLPRTVPLGRVRMAKKTLAEALVDHTPASAESLDPKERTRFAAEIAALI